MPKRRARGTGSIFFDRARGVWVSRVPVGKYPSGRTRYKEVSAPTQGECLKRLRDAGPPAAATTLAAWCERWLKGQTTRAGTKDRVANELRHVTTALGAVRVADLRPSHVREFTASLLAEFSPGFARNVLGVLRQVLDAAVHDDLIAKNPAKAVPKPRVPPAELDVYTPAELKMLVEAHADARCGGITAVLAACGCRIGEAAALDVGDYRGGKLSITKTYGRKHGVGPPKNHRGRRVITVPDVARPAVEAAVGDRKAGILFPSPGGGRYNSATLKAVLCYHLEALGLPVRKVHALRHSVASALVAAGWSLADTAAFLGDSVAVVVATYCHPTNKDPAECLNRLFGEC